MSSPAPPNPASLATPPPHAPPRAEPLFPLRRLFAIEAVGFRTTAAALAPLIVGQIARQPGLGLLVGMGGLQASFVDFEGATPVSLFCGVVGSALAALLGGLVSPAPPEIAIAAMFVVTFGLGMLAAFGEFAGNAAFVLTLSYAFAQNLRVSHHTALTYLVTFLIGGVWAAILTLLLWRLRRNAPDDTATQSPPPQERAVALPRLRGHLHYRSPVFQHALRAAIATGAAATIGRLYLLPHAFWLILTCMVILKPVYADTRRRTLERVGGTVLGGLLAMLPAAYLHNLVALDLLLAALGILAFSHLPRNYGLYVVFLTPFVVLLSAVAAPGDALAALARIYETLLGGALAFTVAFLLRSPRHYLPDALLTSERDNSTE